MVQQDVSWFEIAMNDSVGVKMRKSFADIRHDCTNTRNSNPSTFITNQTTKEEVEENLENFHELGMFSLTEDRRQPYRARSSNEGYPSRRSRSEEEVMGVEVDCVSVFHISETVKLVNRKPYQWICNSFSNSSRSYCENAFTATSLVCAPCSRVAR